MWWWDDINGFEWSSNDSRDILYCITLSLHRKLFHVWKSESYYERVWGVFTEQVINRQQLYYRRSKIKISFLFQASARSSKNERPQATCWFVNLWNNTKPLDLDYKCWNSQSKCLVGRIDIGLTKMHIVRYKDESFRFVEPRQTELLQTTGQIF